jgi:hypothetical protein
MVWTSELQLLVRDHQRPLMMESLYTFDSTRFSLGRLCSKEHSYLNTGKSLRYLSSGKCKECQSQRSRLHYLANRDEVIERVQEYRRSNRDQINQYMRERGARFIKNGLNSHGKERTRVQWEEAQRLLASVKKSIKNAGQCPSVARLVEIEQLRYWRENPDAKKAHDAKWSRHKWFLGYATNNHLRIYHREKSKRRKALQRGNIVTHVSVSSIISRFNAFNNRCAYCDSASKLQIEHVIPISANGSHDITNIVPACQSCNMSKGRKEMESWFKSQQFFTEARLRRIRHVMTAAAYSQPTLPLA